MTRLRVGLAVVLAILAAVPVARAATPLPPPRLNEEQAVDILLEEDGVPRLVSRYPADSIVTEGTYEPRYRDWTVKAWSGPAGQIVLGRVDDATGLVEVAWTGPQVAWPMARGGEGAFGGKRLSASPCGSASARCSSSAWPTFAACARYATSTCSCSSRSRSRCGSSTRAGSSPACRSSIPSCSTSWAACCGWVLAIVRRPPHGPCGPWALAATVFLCGFRGSRRQLERDRRGYSGVIGAHRIASGQAPYGHFPRRGDVRASDRNGRVTLRIQENGRCEGQNEHGDTYGPVAYEAYLPGYAISGGRGRATSCTLHTSRRPST